MMRLLYDLVVLLGYLTICYGQDEPAGYPSTRTTRSCVFNGQVIQHRNSIKVDCNTCTCQNGQVICTEIACGTDEKPGTCPKPTGPSHCAIICSNDRDCPGSQKCCSIGCGIDCVPPVIENRSCVFNGKVIRDGETVQVDCNTCTCVNGDLRCTDRSCEEKPGKCPKPTGPSHCAIMCSHDRDCPGTQKCCNIGCGIDCVPPVIENPGPNCTNPRCPPIPPNCHNIITPRGQCCPVCATKGGY